MKKRNQRYSEGGSWQFGLDWARVLPPYFTCLATIVGNGEFERRAQAVIGAVDLLDPERAELWRLVESVG